jgi:hypothetical protein
MSNNKYTPRLKEGDTFVYTEEMNEVKRKSVFGISTKHLTDRTLKIQRIGFSAQYECLFYRVENFPAYCFVCKDIDQHLPLIHPRFELLKTRQI